MISHQYKFIFIQTPKSLGTSIGQAIDYCTVKPLEEIKDINLNPIRQTTAYKKGWLRNRVLFETIKHYPHYSKFTFCRNPWDRLVSAWANYCRDAMSFETCVEGVDTYLNNETCDSFTSLLDANPESEGVVNKWKKFHPLFAYHALPQVYFIKEGVDYIGRFENPQNDFNIICDKIGISRVTLPHVNKSPHRHYREYYNNRTRNIVARKYEQDIEYFGYKFGE